MLLLPMVALAKSDYDLDKPFGFCTVSSRTSSDAVFNVTGGGCYTYPVTGVPESAVKVIKSTGMDQAEEILKVIENPESKVIIFDGSKGEFIIGRTMLLTGVKDKTFLGINGATLRTKWFLTDAMRKKLDEANVLAMSTSAGTGGTLSNGFNVKEEAERNVRQILIDLTGDQTEAYREAGVFNFAGCQNIIVRNLKFVGPGAVDISGADLISFTKATTHCWIDHCEFYDGTDGNFDITQSSDFNTISWCRFYYTEHSYMHQNTNLVGYSDREIPGYLATTFAYNNWDKGCNQRMPMARVGKIHLLNNYYTCVGNAASINPRINSEVLIEGNYFVKDVVIFSQRDAKAWEWRKTNYSESHKAPKSKGKVSIPYSYNMMDVQLVPKEVGENAGATLPYVCVTPPDAAASGAQCVKFEEGRRYSVLVMDSRLNSFYANKAKAGFGKFDASGKMTETEFQASTKLDYVPGLVAKAVIEAVDYYKDNAAIDVKPWYYAVQNYANKNDISSNGKAGKSFDDLNAVKLYFVLKDLAGKKQFADGALYTNDQTVTIANKRIADALTGIKKADATYIIKEGLEKARGGWWHKASYVNQMWCDGQYMGPALLAQMIGGYSDYKAVSKNDWDLITKQFSICWDFLWDADKLILYHAFSATPTDDYGKTWADAQTGRSKEYWGRAEGWYFLALVDVLEEMQKAGLQKSDNYKVLSGYLDKIAVGLEKWQDGATGCWYQLLQYDGTFFADKYNGKSYTKTYNYLESSATAIFLAAYMKGMRLGLLDKKYIPLVKKGYKGFVENFMVSDGDGGVHLINSCRSAGLGGSSYRDGSAAYYLLGSDVSMVKASEKQTEGKVLGAFILAATEYERMFIDNGLAGIVDGTLNRMGDVNGDGLVNLSDSVSIMKYFVGQAQEVFNAELADINQDGMVTMADANMIVNE